MKHSNSFSLTITNQTFEGPKVELCENSQFDICFPIAKEKKETNLDFTYGGSSLGGNQKNKDYVNGDVSLP